MADLQNMSRILYHHNWVDVNDWAESIARLADLTDDEIAQLEVCCDRPLVEASSPAALRAIPVSPQRRYRSSLISRTRQGFANAFEMLRFGARRVC